MYPRFLATLAEFQPMISLQSEQFYPGSDLICSCYLQISFYWIPMLVASSSCTHQLLILTLAGLKYSFVKLLKMNPKEIKNLTVKWVLNLASK